MNQPKSTTAKPFEISKRVVFEAYQRVKSNRGASGVDGESIEQFEQDLKGNLYKLWNRLSSGSYFPPPVRAVEIPKKSGGVRTLGVPTVADRIAQTVVKVYLEPKVEPLFHDDSYGYRPQRSALDAVGKCRQRCWGRDWVIDVDLKAFFDTIPHDLLMKAVAHHTDERFVLLYVERWLIAPLERPDGTLIERDRGTPQGSAISPLLANLFLHWAFDMWMARTFPDCPFERYADDMVMHCATEAQAATVLGALAQRMTQVGLELHPDKTRIVYCKDANRTGSAEHEQFNFLGYTFRARLARNRRGQFFVGFLPALSNEAAKAIRQQIRSWRINVHSDKTLGDIASFINPIVRGWCNYYGRFYKSWLHRSLRRINDYIVRWARRKYKRLRTSARRAWRWLRDVQRRAPTLFAHWTFGAIA